MVQQLFTDVQRLDAEIRRLRGQIRAISIGGQILPGTGGSSGVVPAAIDGALIRGNATPGWERIAASIPAAGLRNFVGLDNGDLRPSYKALLDSTAPSTGAAGVSSTSGSALTAARRDHIHGMDECFIVNMGVAL